MTKKEEILAYCIKENRKLTAKDILSALYPGKPQPYINTQINELTAERKLIREETRPYTVHVPAPGEEIWEIVDHSRRGRSEISTSGEHKAREAKRADVPSPCTKEVEKYLSGWNGLENYTLQERALNKLFFQTYPHNTEIEDVLVKAAALNDFYSTQIFSVYPVAKHILNLHIDERLAAGDVTLVNEIASVTMESGVEKHFYSFATKYCSHHQPEKYAIFDSYVEKVLKYFRNVDGFSEFSDFELKNYAIFSRVLDDFREFYDLKQYDLKHLDRYLWQLGKDKFPKKYYK